MFDKLTKQDNPLMRFYRDGQNKSALFFKNVRADIINKLSLSSSNDLYLRWKKFSIKEAQLKSSFPVSVVWYIEPTVEINSLYANDGPRTSSSCLCY